MRLVLKIISFAFIIFTAIFAYQNFTTEIQFQLYNKTLSVDLAYAVGLFFVFGLFSGMAWVGSYFFIAESKLKEYKRKLEKTSVNADSSDSRVAVLESKIEVLEKALQSALEKNND